MYTVRMGTFHTTVLVTVFGTLAILTWLAFAVTAHADQLLDGDLVSQSSASQPYVIWNLGHITSGVSNVAIHVGDTGSHTETGTAVRLYCYVDATYTYPTGLTACDGAGGASIIDIAYPSTVFPQTGIIELGAMSAVSPVVYVRAYVYGPTHVGGATESIYGTCTLPYLVNSDPVCGGGNGVPYISGAYSTGGGAPNYATRIDAVAPADSTATTTPVTPSVTYLVASTTLAHLEEAYGATGSTTLTLWLTRVDTGGSLVYSQENAVTVDTLTTQSYPGASAMIANGSYILEAFGKKYSDTGFVQFMSTTTHFIVGSGGNPGNTGLDASSTSVFATSTCDVLNVTGCFQNALRWAFAPSQDSMNALAQSGQRIGSVAPFGYIVLIRNALSSATSTATTSLAAAITSGGAWRTIIFDPLRTMLTMLLWIAALVGLYLYWRNKTI